MADPIGPGDWVEYFQSRFGYPDDRIRLCVGNIYRVDAVVDGSQFEWNGVPWETDAFELVEIVEIDDGGERVCFDPRNFRPVHRPGKSTLIQDLKQSIKDGQPRAPVRAKAQP